MWAPAPALPPGGRERDFASLVLLARFALPVRFALPSGFGLCLTPVRNALTNLLALPGCQTPTQALQCFRSIQARARGKYSAALALRPSNAVTWVQ